MQVGAFQDRQNAERLALTLRAARVPVEVVSVTRRGDGSSSGTQHELFITGSSPEAVNAFLRGRHRAEAAPGGVVIRPALHLRDAVELTRQLAAEGLAVKIRRVARPSGTTQHLVRVGAFPDRARAIEARASLAAQGHSGFLTQGPAR